MKPLPPALLVCLLAAPGLLPACAGGAPPLREGERCRVSLHDVRTGSAFHLVNEAYAPREAFYSRRRGDAATKVLRNEVMQALLDRLEDAGFGRLAQAGSAAEGAAGAHSYVLGVERGGGGLLVARRAGDPPAQAEAIGRMVRDFREVYDGTHALQTIVNPEGPAYFNRESRKPETEHRTSEQPRGW